jgi:SAM-dependent methyltransferase
MSDWIPRGFNSQDEWREHVLRCGCYQARENERIFNKWFLRSPRVVFRRVDATYNLRNKIICDVGCAYGADLYFTAPGSYGLEVESRYVEFAQSVGLPVHRRDVVKDDLSDLPKVDVVWCGALIEHVDAPHILLRNLHRLLNPGGLLFLFAPIIPPIKALRHLPKIGQNFTSHLHDDHVNAFKPKTLQFTCERAGFKTIEVSALYRKPFSLFNRVFLQATCLYVGRAIEGWEYPEHSSRRL